MEKGLNKKPPKEMTLKEFQKLFGANVPNEELEKNMLAQDPREIVDAAGEKLIEQIAANARGRINMVFAGFSEGYGEEVEEAFLEAALGEFYRAIDEAPDNAGLWGKILFVLGNFKQYNAGLWGKIGFVLGNIEQYTEAIEAYKEVIKLVPGNASAWYNLGASFYMDEQYAEAIKAFQKAIKLNPEDANAWYSLGKAFYKMRKYSEAIEPFKKVTELTPDNADVWHDLGVTFYMDGQYAEAVRPFKKVTELAPDNAKAWDDLRRACDLVIEAADAKAKELKKPSPRGGVS